MVIVSSAVSFPQWECMDPRRILEIVSDISCFEHLTVLSITGHSRLSEFASGYSLWRQFGTLNFITKDQYNILIQTFEFPALNEDSDSSPYYIWREGKYYWL